MRKSLLLLLLFAVFSAVSFAQDGLIGYEAPSSVIPGSTVTIDINYTSAVDCDVIVYFRDGTPYNTPETQRFPLTAGADVTTSVDIVIKAETPLGDTYEYAIFLTETGGEWGTRIGDGINTPASVIDGLIGYEAPSSVVPGSTVTIDVNYTSAVDCDLIVYFRNSGLYASPTRFSLTAGTDVTTPVDIVINADAPLGDGYEYAIFLTATGGEWNERIGNGINTPASVVDGLIGYEAPSSVVAGSTVTMNVNYTSSVDCDLIVYFRDGTPYNTPETQRFALTAGADVTTTVEIVIKADTPPGDTYEYAVFLTETGGEWGTRIGNGINTPASVVAPITVELSLSANAGTEADATAIVVTATASEAVSGDQTVNVDVTGVDAGDYTLSETTITIADGETVGTVTFNVVDDTDFEDDETATITISSPSAGIVLGTTVSGDVVIASDDVNVGITNDLSNQSGRISYPTVSSQFIYFESEVKTVKVVNLSGQVVLSKAGSAFRSIDISSLQNSLYIIVIDNNKCEKIIKK